MSSILHTCTTAELRARLTKGEIAGLPKAVSVEDAEAVDAWLYGVLKAACDRVVAAVNTCERNARIAFDRCKVPPSCVHTAYVLARHAVISCIPGMGETLEGTSRAAEYRTACEDLAKLAACELDPGDYGSEGDDPDISRNPGAYVRTVPTMDF